MPHDLEKVAQAQRLNLDHYLHDDIYARLNQILDLNNSLSNINETRCIKLDESLRNYKYNYLCSILICTFQEP